MKQHKPFLIFLLLVSCLLGTQLKSNAQNFLWAKHMGGIGSENGKSITVDAAGSIYTTGMFFGTVDFDPGVGTLNLTSTSDGGDGYITKMDSSGNIIWAKSIEGTGFAGVEANAITTDLSGNIYITGTFFGSVDFDPGAATMIFFSDYDVWIFVLKLDASGNLIWARQMSGDGSGNNYAFSNDIAIDLSGNVYTTGALYGVLDFDPGTAIVNISSTGSEDIFISKLNSSGDFVWAKQIGGANDNDQSQSLVLDASGNVYAAGNFSGTVDFDPGSTTFNLNSTNGGGFVLKMTAGGNFVWAKQIGGGPSSVKTDDSDHLYISGEFNGTRDFDPGAGIVNLVAQSMDIFITKWDTSGNYIWARKVGGPGPEDNSALFVDSAGNAYLCGRFTGTADFDPGSGVFNLSANNGSSFIAKLNAAGNFSWCKQLRANSLSIAADNAEHVYTTGGFAGTVDFDPGTGVFYLTAQGISAFDNDIFVHKIGLCNAATYSSLAVTACDSFIFGQQAYTATGIYNQAFTNAGGCDSIVTLNLTLHNSSGNMITQTSCGSFTLNNQTYTASGTYIQTFTNAIGCDSIITLQLSLNNNDTLLSVTTCDSYTLNSQTYTTSGTYIQTLTNVAGCDSTVQIHLTLNHSTGNALTVISCDSFILNNQTYQSSGTYLQVFTNATGCDSVVTLDLTINNSSSSNLAVTRCNSYQFNDHLYTTSGVYKDTLTTISGCDSIITLSLTINSVNIDVTRNETENSLVALESGATYQWINCDNNTLIPGANQQEFVADHNGNYAVIVSRNDCTDTSDCFNISTLSIDENDPVNFMQLYPNPATGKVTIRTSSYMRHANIQLLTISGQLLSEQKELEGNEFYLDISGYAAGVYIISLKEGNKSIKIKLLKY